MDKSLDEMSCSELKDYFRVVDEQIHDLGKTFNELKGNEYVEINGGLVNSKEHYGNQIYSGYAELGRIRNLLKFKFNEDF